MVNELSQQKEFYLSSDELCDIFRDKRLDYE
jgi:hypothetical protein